MEEGVGETIEESRIGEREAIFSATTKINREDFGLVWNAPLEAGGWLVGKKVEIELEVQATSA